MQTCTWSFLTFSGTFLVRLVVLQDAALKQLDFKLVESSFMVTGGGARCEIALCFTRFGREVDGMVT